MVVVVRTSVRSVRTYHILYYAEPSSALSTKWIRVPLGVSEIPVEEATGRVTLKQCQLQFVPTRTCNNVVVHVMFARYTVAALTYVFTIITIIYHYTTVIIYFFFVAYRFKYYTIYRIHVYYV